MSKEIEFEDVEWSYKYITDPDRWYAKLKKAQHEHWSSLLDRYPGKVEIDNKCRCTMDVIMCSGCQCGGE